MHDVVPFALVVVVAALALLAAVGSSRISEWVRIPTPAIFLVAASVCADLFPDLGSLSIRADQRIVTVALVLILFDGGMHIGLARFRPGRRRRGVARGRRHLRHRRRAGRAGPRALRLRLAGRPARRHRARPDRPGRRLLGARPPRGRRPDRHPARGRVRRQRPGRHRADARDPRHQRRRLGRGRPRGRRVRAADGARHRRSGSPAGWACGGCCSTCRCPTRRSTRCATVAFALLVYGVTTLAHGSGFLAVFLAGILVGDTRAPYKREIERFASAAGSLGEIVAFTVLGLSIPISEVFGDGRAWTGIALAALLILVVRPLFVGLLIAPIRLRRGRARVRAVGRAQGRRADPARHLRRRRGRRRRRPDLRGDLRGRAGLGGRAGRPGADVRPAGGTSGCGSSSPSRGRSGMRFRDEPEGLHRFVVARGSPPTARRSRTSRSTRTSGSAW